MTWMLLVLGVVLVGLGLLRMVRRGSDSIQSSGSRQKPSKQWPVLARTHDRNEAYMIKALLDDANVPCLVEEDRTMGVLYGLPAISESVVRVPEDRYDEARGHLKESSFSENLSDSD